MTVKIINKIVLFVFLILNFNALSQDYYKMMVKKQVDCSDIAYNCGLYYMKFMSENKMDSVSSLLDYWTEECGMREPIYRARVLQDLKDRNLDYSLVRS